MSPQLFILSITCYLVSMVGALIISFLIKHISPKLVNTLIAIHFLLFIFWILNQNESDTVESPGNSNYIFLAFFCSGIVNAGLLIRSKYPVVLKSYFAIYLLSLLIFLVSPSRVLGFVVSGKLDSVNPERYHVLDNYYLVEQKNGERVMERESETQVSTSVTVSKAEPVIKKKLFKLVREMGMFHKTLSRDVALPIGTDSVNCITPPSGDKFNIRVYFNFGSGNDSLDLEIVTGRHQDNSKQIQQKRKS